MHKPALTDAPVIDAFITKMADEGLPDIFIDIFAYYYEQLRQGHTGLIPESELLPVDELPDSETFPAAYAEMGREVLGKTAVIKLNGGLGTSMGLKRAKSLLPIKGELTFLDIIARQVSEQGVPLLLMNSFNTDEDSLAALSKYPGLVVHDLPLSFLQHKAPKIRQADFQPATWPTKPELEWCPPGHGDIYTALVTSGQLDALLDAGYEYAFVSNVDNLGAVVDDAILGYFAQHQIPFMMEVADRTLMDRKGGHLARRAADGQLVLRESAQCPPENKADFQNIQRHKYFNTNNLWLNLPALKALMVERNNRLGLPLIRNSKTVDPRDPASTPVYQMETAMGSAIGVFVGSQAVRVPRSRFAPVKTTNDLLAVRSDGYRLTDDNRIILDSKAGGTVISLDVGYYKFVNDLDARFLSGIPSLKKCTSFKVQGDVRFGRGVVCEGDVHLINESERPARIPAGAVLTGKLVF
ncbi:MAG: UTP--glucose-1-phosphate uridylyltransferase [Anaerolineales bacterium]|nr:UTP--glucose-1-phosphate uridylyltransferase [Anaerolineales bacterium]